mmetsp:Transcript_322/g.1345  ORF Transcript_322/g.1345 Transcript_322/m.1345 type:complete len:82 (-) Transcript_322:590-835(-)
MQTIYSQAAMRNVRELYPIHQRQRHESGFYASRSPPERGDSIAQFIKRADSRFPVGAHDRSPVRLHGIEIEQRALALLIQK